MRHHLFATACMVGAVLTIAGLSWVIVRFEQVAVPLALLATVVAVASVAYAGFLDISRNRQREKDVTSRSAYRG